MSISKPSSTILVLGGTGKVGRRVIEQLTASGHDVRIGSRTAMPAFEWTDRSTWPAVFAGVKAIFISYVPDLAVPGAAEDITALIDLAHQHGVERLVLLSGRGEPEAQRCEQLIQESGLQWTICRAGWFMQNFSESFMRDPVMAGQLAFPGGSMVEPWIDCDDIAEVAAAALTDDRHHGELYELTGPALMSFADISKTFTEILGRPITYTPLTMEAFLASLAEAQVAPELIELMAYLFGEVFDGRNAILGDGVERALGRPATSFHDFVSNAAQAGAWDERMSQQGAH